MNTSESSDSAESDMTDGKKDLVISTTEETYELFPTADSGLVGYTGNFTPEQTKEVTSYIGRRHVGTAESICRTCPGDKKDKDKKYICSAYKKCPLVMMGMPLDVDKLCPIEMTVINNMFASLAKNLGLDPDNTIDCMAIMDIVKWHIIEDRAMDELSDERLLKEVVTAVDPKQGTLFKDLKEHPALNIIQRAQKARSVPMKQLIATREDKSKETGRKAQDPSNFMGSIMDKIRQHKKDEKENSQPEPKIIDVPPEDVDAR